MIENGEEKEGGLYQVDGAGGVVLGGDQGVETP